VYVTGEIHTLDNPGDLLEGSLGLLGVVTEATLFAQPKRKVAVRQLQVRPSTQGRSYAAAEAGRQRSPQPGRATAGCAQGQHGAAWTHNRRGLPPSQHSGRQLHARTR
jgi:hypothetical protein